MSTSNDKAKSFERWDLPIGLFLGAIIAFGAFFLYQFYAQKSTPPSTWKSSSQTTSKIDTVKVGSYTLEIKEKNEVQLREQNEIIAERLKSFSDRLSDFYLALTIIIALLLAIMAGIYFKTKTEVAAHMHKNYSKYKEEIEGYSLEAQKIVSNMQYKEELLEQIYSKSTAVKETQEQPKEV